MKLARTACCGALALMTLIARGESWQTTRGENLEGRLSGVYGSCALISGKKATHLVSVDSLGDAELGRVADYLAAQSASAVPWKDSGSKVAKALKGRLQVLRSGKLVDFDAGTRRAPDFYLVYFGAEW